MRTILAVTACSLALAAAASAGAIREIEVTPDPAAGGKQVFTVRLRPAETHTCDRIVFECVYHQEFPWHDAAGGSGVKTNEPAAFTYRRVDVKLVDDLDCFISFTVPIGPERLRETYGPALFAAGYPITIARLRIEGFSGGVTRWMHVVDAKGLHRMAD